MNPVTMMLFVVCLSGSLLMSSSSNSSPTSPKPKLKRICQTKDLVAEYVRVCRRSLDDDGVETVSRDLDVQEPLKSEERAIQTSKATDGDDEPSLASLVELLLIMDSSSAMDAGAEELIDDDDRSLDSAGEGWRSGRRLARERRRAKPSIRDRKKFYALLRWCCVRGCTDADITRHICE